jgi:hypothetical protein
LHYLASVRLHRDLTDADFSTDLLIQQAGDHQVHDLPFPTRKGRVAVPQRAHLRLVIKGCTTAFQGLPDGAQQHGIAVTVRTERTSLPTIPSVLEKSMTALSRNRSIPPSVLTQRFPSLSSKKAFT